MAMTTTAEFDLLDQLSTSQNFEPNRLKDEGVSWEVIRETQALIEEAEIQQTAWCDNAAPLICYVDEAGKAHLVEGCCNDWTCGRCGLKRAKAEYGRMVEGARRLHQDGNALYFLTLTCRGADMPLETAERDYMKWTNRILSTCRADWKKRGGTWAYVQVTERQKRQHPHSHLITTFRPKDATPAKKGDTLAHGAAARHDCLNSPWMVKAVQRAGLGKMVDISEIGSPVAVAVYVAKYLFKDAMQTAWPKGWKRIRYSHSWPKLPEHKHSIAFPVMRPDDWLMVRALERTIWCDRDVTAEIAKHHGIIAVKVKNS